MPVCPYHNKNVSDAPWDADENIKRLKEDQPISYYDQMFAWRTADNYHGKTANKSDYKFPYHFVNADGDIGDASLKAATAIIASLNGGRGGADIPDADRKGVYDNMVKVYKEAGIEPKDIPELKTNSAVNSKIKTKGLDADRPGTIYLTGTLEVLNQINDQDYAVKLRVMRDGVNFNKWNFQNVKDFYKTFVGRWILCAYVGRQIGDGHNMREVIDPQTNKTYMTFTDPTAERIVGAISENPDDVTISEENGQTWVIANGRISLFYAPELVKKIISTGLLNLSAEIDAIEEHMDGDITVYTAWRGVGVTVLGTGVAPAIPGANIKALAALEDEFKSLKLKAASLQSDAPLITEPQAPPATKPVKGVKITLNKNLIAQIQPKFPNHRIVALSDDSKHVVLMSLDGISAYTYSFRDEDKGDVVPSLITPATLSTKFNFDSDTAVDLDLSDITAGMASQTSVVSKELEDTQKKLKAAEDTITAMKAAEHTTRVQAVKDAVTAKGAEITDSMDGDLLGDSATNICNDAESYADMVDGDGNFCGAAKACSDLKSQCMDKAVELSKSAKLKGASFTGTWENTKPAPKTSTPLEDAVAWVNS